MKRRTATALLVLTALLVWGAGAWAWSKGYFYIRNLGSFVAFSRGAGLTGVEYLPDHLWRIVDTSQIAYDLDEAFQHADSGSLNAYADPAWRAFVALGYPSFSFALEDNRGWDTFLASNVLGAVHIYDRIRDRFVRYASYASSWGVTSILVQINVEDGGRYDLDARVNGEVRVGLAVGAGLTAENDFTQSFWGEGGGGGCDLGAGGGVAGLWLLLPGALLWRRRKTSGDQGRTG